MYIDIDAEPATAGVALKTGTARQMVGAAWLKRSSRAFFPHDNSSQSWHPGLFSHFWCMSGPRLALTHRRCGIQLPLQLVRSIWLTNGHCFHHIFDVVSVDVVGAAAPLTSFFIILHTPRCAWGPTIMGGGSQVVSDCSAKYTTDTRQFTKQIRRQNKSAAC